MFSIETLTVRYVVQVNCFRLKCVYDYLFIDDDGVHF